MKVCHTRPFCAATAMTAEKVKIQNPQIFSVLARRQVNAPASNASRDAIMMMATGGAASAPSSARWRDRIERTGGARSMQTSLLSGVPAPLPAGLPD